MRGRTRASVYVADDAFFPYGHHGEDDIVARVVPLIGGKLIEAHAPDLVVIACNTASTIVMSHLRDAYLRALRRHRAGDQSRPAPRRRPSASRCSAPAAPFSANTPAS